MHPRAATFREQARERYGLDVDVREFEDGTRTAADAAAALDTSVARIASSLVFDLTDADSDVAVVVTSGANRASEERVATHLDAESADLADPDRVRERVGWSIGGVPPICHDADVPVLFDETLLDHDTVYAAAGTPEAVFPVDPETLVECADARAVSVTE